MCGICEGDQNQNLCAGREVRLLLRGRVQIQLERAQEKKHEQGFLETRNNGVCFGREARGGFSRITSSAQNKEMDIRSELTPSP